jgi:quercetin dioxygenase-like cupin family protein
VCSVKNISAEAEARRQAMEENRKSGALERLVAAPAKLVELVDYQEGAVVSRTIIKKNTGTVTLFAFDYGQSLSEHTVPYDATVYLLDGEAEIVIAGKPLHLKAGEIVIMPANEPHAVNAVKRFKMILIMIRS